MYERKLRQVLLPAEVSGALMALAPPDAAGPVFCSRTGQRLGERAVFGILKRTGFMLATSPSFDPSHGPRLEMPKGSSASS
jgi:hypothetical protein